MGVNASTVKNFFKKVKRWLGFKVPINELSIDDLVTYINGDKDHEDPEAARIKEIKRKKNNKRRKRREKNRAANVAVEKVDSMTVNAADTKVDDENSKAARIKARKIKKNMKRKSRRKRKGAANVAESGESSNIKIWDKCADANLSPGRLGKIEKEVDDFAQRVMSPAEYHAYKCSLPTVLCEYTLR